MEKKLNLTTIITRIVFIVAMAIVAFTVYTLLNAQDDDKEKNTTSILGYNLFVVLSGSMSEEFSVGDIAVSKKVDVETIEVGDIISFISIDPNYLNEIVSHKVRSITTYDGQLAFETYGTTTGVSDAYPALSENIIGKYTFTIPWVGNIVVFIQSSLGFALLIILPIAVIFILQIIKLIRRILAFRNEDEIVEKIKDKPKYRYAKHYKK